MALKYLKCNFNSKEVGQEAKFGFRNLRNSIICIICYIIIFVFQSFYFENNLQLYCCLVLISWTETILYFKVNELKKKKKLEEDKWC